MPKEIIKTGGFAERMEKLDRDLASDGAQAVSIIMCKMVLIHFPVVYRARATRY